MAKANGPKAHDILLGYEPLGHFGACLYYVWLAVKAAGAWTAHVAVPTAYQAGQASQGKHYDRNPPEGALIWFGRRDRDGNMDGDVIIAGQFDGDHAATDQPVYGQTGTTTIAAREKLTGRKFLYWTDHIFECPITLGAKPAPAGGGAKPAVGRNITKRSTKAIQKLVGAKQDGIYGPVTTAKVKAWQKAHGLVADGIWGPKSDAKGFPKKVVKGAYADIQRALNRHGYSLVVDNVWGPKSHAALGDFQRKHGLKVDYIVGRKTAAKLGL